MSERFAAGARRRLLLFVGAGLAILLVVLFLTFPQTDWSSEQDGAEATPGAPIETGPYTVEGSAPHVPGPPRETAAATGSASEGAGESDHLRVEDELRAGMARVNAGYFDVHEDIRDLAIRIELLLEDGRAGDALDVLLRIQGETYKHSQLNGFFCGAALSFLPAVARADPGLASAVTEALLKYVSDEDVYRRLAAMAALTGGPRYRASSIDDRWMVRMHLVRRAWNAESPVDRLQSRSGLIEFLPPGNSLAQQLREAIEDPGDHARGHDLEEWAMPSLAAFGRSEDWPLIRDKGLQGSWGLRRSALDAAAGFPYELTRDYLLAHIVDGASDEYILAAAYGSLLMKASESPPASRDLMELLVSEEREPSHGRVFRWLREEARDSELAIRLAAFYASHPDASYAAGMARYIIDEGRADLYDLAGAIVRRPDIEPKARDLLVRDLAGAREGGPETEREARLQDIGRRLDVLFVRLKAMDRSDPGGGRVLDEMLGLIEEESDLLTPR